MFERTIVSILYVLINIYYYYFLNIMKSIDTQELMKYFSSLT